MDLAAFNVRIESAVPTEDQTTYRYVIAVQHRKLTWQVSKRYSSFDQLHKALKASKHAALPPLPPKTLIGRPIDTQEIEARRKGLQHYLHELVARPDTRTSTPLLEFLEFEARTDMTVTHLMPRRGPVCDLEDPRFAVSGVHYWHKALTKQMDVVIVAYQDSSHVARLGRMWTVVEPDELGAWAIWAPTHAGDDNWHRVFLENFAIKVPCMCVEETSRQIFIAMEDGTIRAYHLPDEEDIQPQLVGSYQVHATSVLDLDCSARHLLSIGFDATIRLVKVSTREVVSGGRLAKRLDGKHLTVAALDEPARRAFLGTSGSDVLIYDVSGNPPHFLHALTVMSSGPISWLNLSESHLWVGHDEFVTCYGMEDKTYEKRMPRMAQYVSNLEGGRQVRGGCVIPADKRLIVAYEGGVVVYSLSSGTATMAFAPHDGRTTEVLALPAGVYDGSTTILTAGVDGKVKYVFWHPPSCRAAAAAAEPPLSTTTTADSPIPRRNGQHEQNSHPNGEQYSQAHGCTDAPEGGPGPATSVGDGSKLRIQREADEDDDEETLRWT
ncbi:unnamed protein product [Vitrella brassicaformis CCMP3155]|uniref:PX domain-containing protein n=2 Tax=Vitrella brassicaformis TaxID=1169539 RepID=A0A0G4FUK8_VITBC|nr:unnamed protein product [Vitrella brassicaformis CCMP3155]|eukprot:CEM18623.1 unnamed protein product [Vitrella brassicaformis CCMP3155]